MAKSLIREKEIKEHDLISPFLFSLFLLAKYIVAQMFKCFHGTHVFTCSCTCFISIDHYFFPFGNAIDLISDNDLPSN